MTNGQMVSKLFRYLANNGETSADKICKDFRISRNYLLLLISRMRCEHNQGVFTNGAGDALAYKLNDELPYTFEERK